MKKALSCLLCIAMMFSFVCVAFAANTPAVLKSYVTGGSEDLQQYKTEIETVTFTKSSAGVNAVNNSQPWDVSASGDGSVSAWLEDADSDGLYEAYITANGADIYANTDSAYLFEGYSALTAINGMDLFVTDNVRYMRSMFAGCSSLSLLDLQYFGMSNVLTTESMFENCKSLSLILGFGRLDTSSVILMNRMFFGCESLTSLDMSTFNTENVTDMSYMFFNCKKLSVCDFGYIDTVIDTDYLEDTKPSAFRTGKVVNMSYMFSGCQALKKLNLNGFETSNLKNVEKMFYGCRDLESLDLSNWSFAGLGGENLALYQFVSGCRKLDSLYIHNISAYNIDFYDFQQNFENVSGVKIYTLDEDFEQTSLWTNVLKYMQGSSIIFSNYSETKAILTFTVENGVSYYCVSEIGSDEEDFIFSDETRSYDVNTKLKIRLYGSYPEYTFYVNGEPKTILREEAIYILVNDDASVYAVGEGLSEDFVEDEDKNPDGDGQVANNFLGVFSIIFNKIIDFFKNLFSFIKF